MIQTTSITGKTAPIVVMQGAYRQFCIPGDSSWAFNGSYENIATIIPSLKYATFATIPPVDDWLRFNRLVEDWYRERGAMSSITDAAVCPAYQSIIGMGMIAVPFIFARLDSEGSDPDQWFWALKAILGIDPVADNDRGNYPNMAKSWLEWAKYEGYAW